MFDKKEKEMEKEKEEKKKPYITRLKEENEVLKKKLGRSGEAEIPKELDEPEPKEPGEDFDSILIAISEIDKDALRERKKDIFIGRLREDIASKNEVICTQEILMNKKDLEITRLKNSVIELQANALKVI